MARCPDCNKFVSYEQQEPELELNVELNADKQADVHGSVRLVLTCADCGTEMAEADCGVQVDVELAHKKKAKEHEVELHEESAESTDRYDGKPGTPSRYRRHFYGADVSGKVVCSCGAENDFNVTVEEQAGAFDSMC